MTRPFLRAIADANADPHYEAAEVSSLLPFVLCFSSAANSSQQAPSESQDPVALCLSLQLRALLGRLFVVEGGLTMAFDTGTDSFSESEM